MPERTLAVLDGDTYYTGDLGFLHAGELFVVGRTDDMIVSYGKNLLAHEIEADVNDVPGIRRGRCVAFGVQQPSTGTTELAVVYEPDDGADPAAINRLVKGRLMELAGITVRYVEPVAAGSLVKTTSGKISREHNRARFMRHLDETAASAP